MSAPETRPVRLDVIGMRCPIPLLLTRQLVRTLAAGARVEVVGDDPEMLDDFPAWSEESGHRLLEIGRVGELVRCLVEVAAGPADAVRP